MRAEIFFENTRCFRRLCLEAKNIAGRNSRAATDGGAPEGIRTPDPQIRSQRNPSDRLTTSEIRNDQEVAKLRRHSIFLIHSLSLSPERAIMTRHEHSPSAIVSASTVLPTADVIRLPTVNRKRPVRAVFTKTT
ncbi:MAG: hypothetical protein WBE93_01305, partial [Pseudolabrys sp.]